MEGKNHSEQPTEQQPQQQQQQLQSIVTSNGVRILSKLNPAAKEFYPSHITRRNQMFHEIIKETKSAEKFLENINDESKETPTVPGRIEIPEKEVCVQPPQPTQPPEEAKKQEPPEEVENKCQEVVSVSVSVSEVVKQEQCKDTETVVVNEPTTVAIVDDKVCGDCLNINDNEVVEEKKPLEMETLFKTSEVITECMEEEKTPSLLMIKSTTSDEVKALIKEIEDEINAEKNNEDATVEMEPVNTDTPLEQDEDLAEELIEAYEKTVAEEKLEQKKATSLKKHSALKRVSKIALSSLKKASSGHSNSTSNSNSSSQASGDKSTAQKTASSTSSSTMSRTKRISESLHNLSTTLKSKTSESKNVDITAVKIPGRGTTTIPRSFVRSRPPLIKSTDVNGLKKEIAAKTLAKDAISLRSTSSTEKSVTSKSSLSTSTHSAASSKKLHGKISATSTLSSDGKSITTAAAAAAAATLHATQNSKDSTQKLPRGTVASSLRQTEAQKRRNLFPIDDLEANIELSQFLFK